MRTILSFVCIYLSFAMAGSTESLVQQLAPSYVKGLDISKPFKEKEAKKVLGKPDLVRGDAHYYSHKNLKYPLEITYKNGQAIRINAVMMDKKVPLKKALKELKSKNISYEVDTSDHIYAVVTVKKLSLKIKSKHSGDFIYSFVKEYGKEYE